MRTLSTFPGYKSCVIRGILRGFACKFFIPVGWGSLQNRRSLDFARDDNVRHDNAREDSEQAQAECRREASDFGTMAEGAPADSRGQLPLGEEGAALGVALEEGELGRADFVDVGLGEGFHSI